MSDEEPLLSVRNLEKHYPITEGLLRRETGRIRAVDGIRLDVHPGKAVGLVGESGCGKSTTALSVLRLEEPTGGEVHFDGENVLEYGSRELRRYRRRVQLVLQDPDSAFNPRMPVGDAVEEPLRVHGMTDSDRRRRIVEDTLERVGLAAGDADGYPHEFSGGEKQRIALARALVLNPDLVVADEPVSALDGRTKADVLQLMDDLQESFDLSVLLISHDVDVVRRFCDRIAVMYLGAIVERGPTDDVVGSPKHPYTRALLSSVPDLDQYRRSEPVAAETLTDDLPDASDVPSGCRFHPRCSAIIQPDELDLPGDEWLALVSFRFFLETEWSDVETFRTSLSDGQGFDDRIRTTFDLPDRLADDDAETALDTAVSALESDDISGAREALRSVTAGVCERQVPSHLDVESTHEVACHRYDPDVPGRTDLSESDVSDRTESPGSEE